jgi:hypothetical protein
LDNNGDIYNFVPHLDDDYFFRKSCRANPNPPIDYGPRLPATSDEF